MTRYRSFASSTGAFIFKPEENEKSEPFSNRKQVRIFLVWWARVDSNHRSWKQQIYSLSPLATREHAHIQFCSPWIACIYYHPDDSLSTSFAEFLDFCAESKSTKAKAAQKSTFLSGFLELVTGVERATGIASLKNGDFYTKICTFSSLFLVSSCTAHTPTKSKVC